MDLQCAISIHAPARGATKSSGDHAVLQGFQSTLPRGERRVYEITKRGTRRISIHAPARGATTRIIQLSRGSELFQSTLPRGERHPATLLIQSDVNFNPRSREGSDRKGCRHCCLWCISIHAPARGATKGMVWNIVQCRHFNPRSREGSDEVTRNTLYGDTYNFNPRSREGSD